MNIILKKIASIGIVTEKMPLPRKDWRTNVPELSASILKAFGRSMAIRHVDAGSCNACELEIHALSNPFYNIESQGIHFVASPRHADVLLVTGPVSRHMVTALQRTYEAMPHPKLVITIGDCGGCTGGIFGESYATCSVNSVIPVNVQVPGCPPSPVDILQGILALVSNSH